MKILSWNVNGLRAVLKKGFLDFLQAENPDILGVQEIKLQEDQLPGEVRSPAGYRTAWNFAERKGYSGTAMFYRQAPRHIKMAFTGGKMDREGRVIEMEYPGFSLLNIYFPNGQMNDERLQYKLQFYDECLDYLNGLRGQGKKLIIMGDYNTAHKEIDLENPKANAERSGFLPIERAWLDKLVSAGYIDTFRLFHPGPGQYTWWTYRFRAREKNIGWRIDYFFISEDLRGSIVDAYILADVYGSDHCPIGLKIKI
jgi:exodeoxyribonuclease-3